MLYPQSYQRFRFIKNKVYGIIILISLFLVVGKAWALTLTNPIDPIRSVEELLQTVINYFLEYIAAPLMVITLIIGGIRYITAGANERRAQEAKKMIKWALIGIVIIVGSLAIVNTVISLLAGRQ